MCYTVFKCFFCFRFFIFVVVDSFLVHGAYSRGGTAASCCSFIASCPFGSRPPTVRQHLSRCTWACDEPSLCPSHWGTAGGCVGAADLVTRLVYRRSSYRPPPRLGREGAVVAEEACLLLFPLALNMSIAKQKKRLSMSVHVYRYCN